MHWMICISFGVYSGTVENEQAQGEYRYSFVFQSQDLQAHIVFPSKISLTEAWIRIRITRRNYLGAFAFVVLIP